VAPGCGRSAELAEAFEAARSGFAAMTVEQTIQRVLIGHIRMHQGSIQAALANAAEEESDV
jgi:hypothetical protein